MDALPSPPELTSDIQRAIQQAVGQANNAFIRHQVINQSRSAKRKRTKEKATTEETEENHKKKKAVGHASSQASTSASAAEQPATHSKSRKTSLKQGSKTVADVGSANEPSSNPPSLSQSPAAFLDAVVSAASATAAPSDTPYGFSQPCFDTPLSPSYPFSPVAGGLTLNTAAFQPPISFTNPAVSGLEYASSDDILHALQELDVSKIASVLKTLGEAAAAANIPLASLSSTLLQRPQPVTPIDPAPSNPTVISESTTQRVSQHHRRFVDMTTHHESLEHSDHAELLATKWLSANKLAELARTQGLVYKKGKFSAIEEQQLSDAIQAYKEANRIDDAGFLDLVFAKNGAAKNNAFWSAITAAVPMRPIIAIYHHVRRTYHPLRAQGKWMPSEDALLKAAVQELGQQWEKVSDRVGRMASDCRDRYRNHIQNSEDRAVGPWTKDEEMRLTQIVTDMTVKQGKDINNEVFWGVVSERMGNRRGRQQCRIKWTDSLSKTFKNNGTKPRWSSRDAYILVHKVDSLHVRDDSEVDWKTLPDPNWNLWSAHTLQRRWLTMKRSVRGHEDMTHAEILDILRLKKLHLPGSRSRAVVSAEAVEDSDDVDDGD